MNQELLRIVDGLARDKNIDKETVFEDLEAAMLSAIRKAHSGTDDIDVRMDRSTGDITVMVDGERFQILRGAVASRITSLQQLRHARQLAAFCTHSAHIAAPSVRFSLITREVRTVGTIGARALHQVDATFMPQPMIGAILLGLDNCRRTCYKVFPG